MNPFPESLACCQDCEKKYRKISILKSELLKSVDVLTYKFVDASADQTPQRANAISSDSAEALDAHILMDSLKTRDADLRTIMQTVLLAATAFEEDNIPDDENVAFVYRMSLPVEFNDAMLAPLAQYMSRYLTYGALYDWYGLSMGIGHAQLCEREAEKMEAKVTNIIRTPSITKRPLQPFGPAGKMNI